MPPHMNNLSDQVDCQADAAESRLAYRLTMPQEEDPDDAHLNSSSRESVEQEDEGSTQDQMAMVIDFMQQLMNMAQMPGSNLRIIPGSEFPMFLDGAATSGSDYMWLGAEEPRDKEIEERSRALSLTPEGAEDRPHRLFDLGVSHALRFEYLGHLADIDKAILYLDQAVLLTPDDHEDKPDRLSRLGDSYGCRFRRLHDLSDIDKGIEAQRQVVSLTSDDHPRKLIRLNVLASSYVQRFEKNGDVADIDKAIEFQSKALGKTPAGHTDKALWLYNLGLSYQSRFELERRRADLDESIRLLTQAVALTPEGDVNGPDRLNALGVAYYRRFERWDDLPDLDRGSENLIRAVLLTPDGHEDKPGLLDNLGNSYHTRFERLGELEDINTAIEYRGQVVLLTVDGDPARPRRLNNLGASYSCRFQRLGELSDIEAAINYSRVALLETPDRHPNKPDTLDVLGSAYALRYEHDGQLSGLEKAIDYQSRALQLIPDSRSHLSNLGVSHLRRFERLGAVADVDKAIEYLSQPLLSTPDDHPHMQRLLSNLGAAYQARFLRLHERSDIDKGIEYLSRAVQLTPDDHAFKLACLSSLGNAYMHRFNELSERADLEKATKYMTKALLLTPEGHAAKSGLLNSLGYSHYRRFEHVGDVADIEKAIDLTSQAVQLTPENYKGMADYLSNLGNSYANRFKRLGDMSDIDKAIEYHSQAAELTPDDYANKPGLLANLADSYNNRFKLQGNLDDLECARSYFQQAAQSTVTRPTWQLRSARAWARTSSQLGVSPELAYQRAMDLVPHLIWLGATIAQRYNLLTKISDVATEAVAWAISAQSYDLALQWFEQGRSIVWNQILQLRAPFDDLFAVNPTLAERLQDIARQLEHAGSKSVATESSTNGRLDLDQGPQHHHRLATEWERLLGEARELPGFQSFMRPHAANKLKLAAKDGPVVLINTDSTRCDALIVLPDNKIVGHVPLEKISPWRVPDVRAYLKLLIENRGLRARGFKRANPAEIEDTLKPLLGILWLDVVKPILDFLGYTHKLPVDELPHVTWCATGALAFLPLHAASLYNEPHSNAFDLVVSSYAPTLSALLPPTPPSSLLHSGVLAVGQESSQGLGDLPNTVLELAAIKKHTGETHFQQLNGQGATVDAVLSAMDRYSWVHLACHATQDQTNPAHSAFRLYDGNLTLEAITRRSFKNKGLAFLSACETATGDEVLPDESVHLAAGMLMAGYPSVIATMWSILDEDAPGVAGQVYGELLKDGKTDCTGTARALHKAVFALREKVGEDSFERWVPFIHMGV